MDRKGLAILLATLMPLSACAQPATRAREPVQGVLEQVQAPDGHAIYVPKLPPQDAYMTALLEGTLIENDGCL